MKNRLLILWQYFSHRYIFQAGGLCLFILILKPTSIAKANSLTLYTSPTTVTVTMNRLIYLSDRDTGTACVVDPPDTNWGCTWFDTAHYPVDQVREYPYATNPVTIPIETDYLLDVVPQEMGTYYHPTAQQVQAIAARTYAYWHIAAGYTLNNSNSYHVFVPMKFESLLPVPIATITETRPCDMPNLGPERTEVCEAVAPQHYITYGDYPNAQPIYAEFHSDIVGHTITNTTDRANNPTPYLKGVPDPVSTACDADTFGHGHGVSQEGASRWASGHECSYPGAKIVTGNAVGGGWSVQPLRADQILTHYYTRVQIRDSTGTRQIPDYRWLPIQVAWPATDRQVPAMRQGFTYPVTVTLQNTGVLT